ncbi:hypothetical protein ACOSVF_004408 [Salmonella enterica subsp. enterica]
MMWKKKIFNYVLMNSEPGEGGGNGGQGDGGEGTGGNGGSVLGDGSGGGANILDWMPEKFRVMDEAGALNVEASSRKLAEDYAALSGSTATLPESHEGYEPKIESEWLNFEEFKKDPEGAAFLKSAHAKGLTNEQVEFVLNEYGKRAPELISGAGEVDRDATVAELKQAWKTDAEFNANVQNAYRAFQAFASPDDIAKMDEIGNNPVVIRLLAKVGAEIQEDKPFGGGDVVSGEDVKSLMMSEAYRNEKHPDHASVSAKVQRYYAHKYGNQAIA